MSNAGFYLDLRRSLERHAWTAALILVSVHALLAWYARAPAIFADQAVYVSLGNAIRELHYRELFRIDRPVHTMYPPGYPLLLAAWSAVGGTRLDWLVLVSIGSTAATLLLFFSAVRARVGSAVALACLCSLAFNPSIAYAGGWVLSEAPFMLWQTLALWAVSRHDNQPERVAVAGAAAIVAALTRSAGVSLIVALAVYWVWKRQYRTAFAFGAIAGAIVGSWLAFTAGAPEQVAGSSYIADAFARPAGGGMRDEIAARVTGKLTYLQQLYWQLPMPGVRGTIVDNLISTPIVLSAGVVGLFALLSRWPAAVVYIGVYAALLMVWPWTIGRFLIPILPWVVLMVILGIAHLLRVSRPSWRIPSLLVAASLFGVTGLTEIAGTINDRQQCDRKAGLPSQRCLGDLIGWASFFAGVQHIRTEVPSDAVLVSLSPASLYYHTGHRVVSLIAALRQTPPEFLPFLDSRSATHIFLSTVGGSSTSLGAMVKSNCDKLHLEASFPPSAHLFRLPRTGESPDSGAACHAVDEFIRLNGIP